MPIDIYWPPPSGSSGGTGSQGPPGPQGDPGPKGSKGDTGAAGTGFIFRGQYNSGSAYETGDSVMLDGAVYVASAHIDAGTSPPASPWNVLPVDVQVEVGAMHFEETYDETAEYTLGASVLHVGKLYVAIDSVFAGVIPGVSTNGDNPPPVDSFTTDLGLITPTEWVAPGTFPVLIDSSSPMLPLAEGWRYWVGEFEITTAGNILITTTDGSGAASIGAEMHLYDYTGANVDTLWHHRDSGSKEFFDLPSGIYYIAAYANANLPATFEATLEGTSAVFATSLVNPWVLIATSIAGEAGPRGPQGPAGSSDGGNSLVASGEAWTPFLLSSAVADVATSSGVGGNRVYSQHEVRIDGEGFVNLRGRIRATNTGDRIVTTLDAKHRPPKRVELPTNSKPVRINSDGVVTMLGAGTNDEVSLEAIRFESGIGRFQNLSIASPFITDSNDPVILAKGKWFGGSFSVDMESVEVSPSRDYGETPLGDADPNAYQQEITTPFVTPWPGFGPRSSDETVSKAIDHPLFQTWEAVSGPNIGQTGVWHIYLNPSGEISSWEDLWQNGGPGSVLIDNDWDPDGSYVAGGNILPHSGIVRFTFAIYPDDNWD